MARRYDPERRERIIDAAIRVVGAKGIAGLSHRSVAAEADVPLGSTTYHFASLDELLIAALRRTNENFATLMRQSRSLADPAADLAGELARLLGEFFGAGRGPAELEYELYLAALQPARAASRRRRVGRRHRRTPGTAHRPGHGTRTGRADGRDLPAGTPDRRGL